MPVPKYSVAELISSPGLAGYDSSVVTGALFDLESDAQLTVRQAQARIETWLGSPAAAGPFAASSLEDRPHAIVATETAPAAGDLLVRAADLTWVNVPSGGALPSVGLSSEGRPTLAVGNGFPVAGRTQHPAINTFGAVNDRYNSAMTYVARFPAGGMRLVYSNWYVGNGFRDEYPPLSITVRAAVEYPMGSKAPVLFQGKRDVVIEPAGNAVSDLAAPAIPAGATFRIWTYVTPAVGGAVPLVQYQANLGSDGHEHNGTILDKTFTRTFTATAASGATALTGVSGLTAADVGVGVSGTGIQSGTTLTAATTTTATLSLATTAVLTAATLTLQATTLPAAAEGTYAPSLILAPPSPGRPIVGMVGDSITQGVGDSHDDTAGARWGFQERAFATFARANIARAGEWTTGTIGGALRRRMVEGCTHIFEAYGSNDLLGLAVFGTSDITGFLASKLGIWRDLSLGGQRIHAFCITPRGTTNPAQLALVTVSRNTYNDWLRDGAPYDSTTYVAVATGTLGANIARADHWRGKTLMVAASGPPHILAATIDAQYVIENGVNTNVWVSGMDSGGDLTHPSAAGAAAIAAVVPTNLVTA